jgi:putative membrane protein
MPDLNDPRVFFAAERTLLAWLRTSLALMGFGFVVARFGLYLRMLTNHPINPLHRAMSTAIGEAFVVLGLLAAAIAAVQHWRFIQTLPGHDRPKQYWLGFALLFALALAMLGALLAVYLLVWMYE